MTLLEHLTDPAAVSSLPQISQLWGGWHSCESLRGWDGWAGYTPNSSSSRSSALRTSFGENFTQETFNKAKTLVENLTGEVEKQVLKERAVVHRMQKLENVEHILKDVLNILGTSTREMLTSASPHEDRQLRVDPISVLGSQHVKALHSEVECFSSMLKENRANSAKDMIASQKKTVANEARNLRAFADQQRDDDAERAEAGAQMGPHKLKGDEADQTMDPGYDSKDARHEEETPGVPQAQKSA